MNDDPRQDVVAQRTAEDVTIVLPPLPRDEAIFPADGSSAAQRELYQALISGFQEEEKDGLEDLMIDNIERLRSDGDSYAP
jgi:hypothetical protein